MCYQLSLFSITGPYDIIVATTKIINGNTLLKSCFDKEVVNFLKL